MARSTKRKMQNENISSIAINNAAKLTRWQVGLIYTAHSLQPHKKRKFLLLLADKT